MGRSPYQSEKRRKELARLKKQEEKRQRRFNKKHGQESPEGQAGDQITGQEASAENQPVTEGLETNTASAGNDRSPGPGAARQGDQETQGSS